MEFEFLFPSAKCLVIEEKNLTLIKAYLDYNQRGYILLDTNNYHKVKYAVIIILNT